MKKVSNILTAVEPSSANKHPNDKRRILLGLSQKIEALITIFFLLSTSIITVATSKKSDYSPVAPAIAYPNTSNTSNTSNTYNVKTYLVASNCSGALPQERIVVAGSTIQSPTGINYIDFGLPMSSLDFVANPEISGIVGSMNRTCQYSNIVQASVPLDVYTCFENSQQICQVSFESVPNQ